MDGGSRPGDLSSRRLGARCLGRVEGDRDEHRHRRRDDLAGRVTDLASAEEVPTTLDLEPSAIPLVRALDVDVKRAIVGGEEPSRSTVVDGAYHVVSSRAVSWRFVSEIERGVRVLRSAALGPEEEQPEHERAETAP